MNITIKMKERDQFNKKVHIVPLGYETVRLTNPVLADYANRVYILSHDEVLKGKDKRGYACLKEIRNTLKKANVEVIEESVGSPDEFFNLYSLMAKICYFVRKEQAEGNIVRVNISAGSKISAAAGCLICQMYNADAYYVVADYSNGNGGKACHLFKEDMCSTNGIYQNTSPVNDKLKEGKISIPYFHIETLEDEMIVALDIIQKLTKEAPAGATQEKIIKMMIAEGLGGKGDKEELSDFENNGEKIKGKVKLPGPLRLRVSRKYFQKLMAEGLIEKAGSNRVPLWSLTEKGEEYLKMFGEGSKYAFSKAIKK